MSVNQLHAQYHFIYNSMQNILWLLHNGILKINLLTIFICQWNEAEIPSFSSTDIFKQISNWLLSHSSLNYLLLSGRTPTKHDEADNAHKKR